MCKYTEKSATQSQTECNRQSSSNATSKILPQTLHQRQRRGKRDKQSTVIPKEYDNNNATNSSTTRVTRRVKSKSRNKHENDAQSGGVEALIPSLIGIGLLTFIIMGKMGFRGRANVAGIDLGTTNSVICVQEQSKGVGKIECIPDPYNNSPIIPSVVSFLNPHYNSSQHGKKKTIKSKNESVKLNPDPSHVLVGSEAKSRINSHPHHTVYHAKRVLGRKFHDEAVSELRREVEFDVVPYNEVVNEGEAQEDTEVDVAFSVPFHIDNDLNEFQNSSNQQNRIILTPQKVGSYIVNHLIQITHQYLQHENIKNAVIAVPAKFSLDQRRATTQAFQEAGVTVTRILEEPVAAALAYGLQKKVGVDHIIVYDFGGGTLDVSVLHVSEGGYVEVIGSDGDNELGGADFDAAIARFLKEGSAGEVLIRVAEALDNIHEGLHDEKLSDVSGNGKEYKEDNDVDVEYLLASKCPKLHKIPLCTLSSFHTIGEKMKIELSSFVDGKEGLVKKECLGLPENVSDASVSTITELCSLLEPVSLELSLDQYNSVCEPLYQRSILPMRRILDDLNLEADEIDEVVMVGGTTRIPQIRELVKRELKVDSLNTYIDPDLTVAYGAASVID